MVETIFEFLGRVGFTHPVHPALTHVPMGMVMGAVAFRLGSFLPKMKGLARTGYHCVVLGLLGIPPTIFTGYLDWQHRYGGEWETLIIIKMVLAGILTLLMAYIAFTDDPENPGMNQQTGLYLLMVVLAVGLGFSGGELIFG